MIDFRSVRESRASAFDYSRFEIASPEDSRPEGSQGARTSRAPGFERGGRGAKSQARDDQLPLIQAGKDGSSASASFGPVKDWECHCGKYKRIRYRGVICDGRRRSDPVEGARERMGHIELAVPLPTSGSSRPCPVRWATCSTSRFGDLEKVIYYSNYIGVEPGQAERSNRATAGRGRVSRAAHQVEEEGTAPSRDIARHGPRPAPQVDVDKTAEQLRAQVFTETRASEEDAAQAAQDRDAFRNSGDDAISAIIPIG